MPSISAFVPIDMRDAYTNFDFDGGEGTRSSTQFFVNYQNAGETARRTISAEGIGFTYSGNSGFPLTGTIQYFQITIGNSLYFTLENLNISVATFRSFVVFGAGYDTVDELGLFNAILSGDDSISGSNGNDYLMAFAGNDGLFGYEGDDTLDGGAGNDLIAGDVGNDTLIGGTGSDGIYAGDGDDLIFDLGDGGVVDGGSGNDAVTFEREMSLITLDGVVVWQPGDTTINASPGDGLLVSFMTPNSPSMYVTGVELINGLTFDPHLFTQSTNGVNFNQLTAAQITLVNADPAAIYDSLGGSDTVSLPDTDRYQLTAEVIWNPLTTFLAGAGNDTVNGGTGADRVDAGGGNDTVNGGPGADHIDGGVGNDTVNGGTGTDSINGDDGADILNGQDDADSLSGGDGDDTVRGGEGNDSLTGGRGNDILEGGAGNDEFQGVDPNNTNAEQTGTNQIDGGDYGEGIFDTVNYSGARSQYDIHVLAPSSNTGAGFAVEVSNKGTDSDNIINWTSLNFAGGVQISEASLAQAGVISFALWSLRGAFEAIHDYVGRIQDFLGTPGATEYPFAVNFLKWYSVIEQVTDVAANAAVDVNSEQYRSALKVLVDRAIEKLTNPIIDEASKKMKEFVDSLPPSALTEQMKSLIDDGVRDLRSYIDDATNLILDHAIDSAINLTEVDWSATWGSWMDTVLSGVTDLYQQIPGMSDPSTEFDDPHLQPIVPEAPTIETPDSAPSDASAIILGSAGSDFSYPGGGDDVFLGLGGDDILIAGHGNGDDLYDGGEGIDEIRFVSAQQPLVIDLMAGTAVGVETGNDIVLGFERVISGSGSDIISGSANADELDGGAGNDTITGSGGMDRLTGGFGNDTFLDTAAGLNGDTITDFTAGDRIVISNASLAEFSFSISGNILTFTGGSLSLGSTPAGTIVASIAVAGGVQLTMINDVRNDFNGDGLSDILWRNVDGQLSNWLGQANGGFAPNNANAASVVPIAWQVAGTGDFNGDGRDDILWRNVDGQLSNWLGAASGGFTANDANAAAVVPTDWHVVGTGDFNGDGRDDILWRNTDGTLSNWLGTAAGGFTPNDANAARFVPTDWHVVGTGDFNGDGRDDILWRNDNGQLSNWLGQANGGFTLNDAVALTTVPNAWLVAGTGDFNGDGRDDILWRNTDGQLSNWLGQANGGFTPNDANAAVFVPTDWMVVATGDYNGDGRDDILWRHTDGTLSNWLGAANGGFNANDANAAAPVPTAWHVQPEPFLL